MKSRKVNRFLAILSVCAIVLTSTPLTANAAESVSGNSVKSEAQEDAADGSKLDKSNEEAYTEPVETTDTESSNGEVETSENEGDNVDAETINKELEGQPVTPISTFASTATSLAVSTTGTAVDAVSPVSEGAPAPSASPAASPSASPAATPTATPPASTPTEPAETPKVEVDAKSGLNVYHPIASEFTVDGSVVTGFTPSLSQSYDLISVPGVINSQAAQYGSDFLSGIGRNRKGIIFESGATLTTSAQNLEITYVRFESGSKAVSASSTFKGWRRLESVIGFGEALAAGGNKDVAFDNTFSGCIDLTDVELNIAGITATFNHTFDSVDNVGSIRIKNGNINNISYLNSCSTSVGEAFSDLSVRNVTFSDIVFPSNTTSYLSHAFTNMNGNVIFNNCTSDGNSLLNFDEAYAGSTIARYLTDADSTGSWSWEPGEDYNVGSNGQYNKSLVKITGASAYSAKSMFESALIKNVDLTGFITTDTIALDKMFKGSTFAGITGVESWKLGTPTVDEMFASTRVYFGPKSYLTATLIPSIKRLDWSGVTSANNLFGFVYKGAYTIDYSGMDLSGAEDMSISSLSSFDFITPAKNPSNFVFSKDNVYALKSGSMLGGKALDALAVEGGKVSGTNMPVNTHIYTDYATISITDIASGNLESTPVVPGYKLSEYLDGKILYYQDQSLSQPVSADLVVNGGDNISVYCELANDGVDRDLIDKAEVDFGDNPENIEITLADGSKDKLKDGGADMSIKIESTGDTDDSMVVPSEGVGFAKSAFFNIDLVATIGGATKKVSEISQKATVVLPLPADYTSGDVVVLNYHEGFRKAPIVLAGRVNSADKTVSFETDKFSPYVMLYDEDVETESVVVNIKWSGDVKDKSGRQDITITDTVEYQNGSTLEVSGKYTKDTTKDEGVITLTYPKTLGGSAFKSHSFTDATSIEIENYSVRFDSGTYTYIIDYNGSYRKETVNVTVDYSALSDVDYTKHFNTINSGTGKVGVTLEWKYDDNSTDSNINTFTLASNQRVYTVPIEVVMQKYSGAKFAEYTNIRSSEYSGSNYESVADLENLKVSFNPVGADSFDKTKYNFVVKIVDNNNATKQRPEKLGIDFTAKYGSYTRKKYVEVNLKGISGNVANGNVEFPTTVGGVTMTSLDAGTSTATNIGYSSTWDNNAKLFKYILAGASETDPDPVVTIDPVDVLITFVGDTATARPQNVVVTLVDSKGQNPVTKEIKTTFAAGINSYKESVQRLVNDTYHVSGVSGIDATKYKVEYNGLNITATYNAGSIPATPSYKKTLTINMDDNSNEDGVRPKSMKVTISNNSGSDTVTCDITVGDANSFTMDVDVKNPNDEYKVKSVSGVPDSYEVTMSGMTVTCKHKVEKIQKTFKVEWSGDADNADKTRPGSVQLTIKNGGTTIKTATVSEDTNWSVNVELNKLIKGVEANYTVEGADVSNYSKSESGDTVTYKFTGTLSKDAADAQAKKDGNAVSATSLEGQEPTYDIANFDWIDYANKYPDLKKAFGYNKEALYAHYIRYGIGEGRTATFTGKYATVNEDVLKAYFPDDYKYKTNLSSTNEEYLIGADKTPSTSGGGSSSATDSGNKVTVDEDGNVHTTVKNEDGTTTETVTDKDGNIISVSTYKTGDLRLEDMSTWFIVAGVLMLLLAAVIVLKVVKDDKRKRTVLSMIS